MPADAWAARIFAGRYNSILYSSLRLNIRTTYSTFRNEVSGATLFVHEAREFWLNTVINGKY